MLIAVVGFQDDLVSGYLCRDAVDVGQDHLGSVGHGQTLDAGSDVGGFGPQQRDSLALHVGAHERSVCVVVLEERDQRCGHRHDLLRRHVHKLDFGRRHVADLGGGSEVGVALHLQAQVFQAGALGTLADKHAGIAERTVGIERRVGLRYDVFLFLVGGQVNAPRGWRHRRGRRGTATR